jgi:putative membrane protein
MLMGAADLVPGVSGGTIALITGVYKELLKGINEFSWEKIKLIKNEGFKKVWQKLNGAFLLSIFTGIISSILLLSRALEWLIINEPIGLWSFFLGLLIASILFLIKTELKYNLKSLFCLSIGFMVSYIITQLNSISNEAPIWYIFIAGFIGISAMILPGLSGAYILFIMGVYEKILSNIRQAQDLIFTFNQEQFIEVTSILSVFVLGIFTGVKVFSRLLSWLLSRYPDRTFAFLIGLMIGALGKVWPWQNQLEKLSEDASNFNTAVLPQDFNGASPEVDKALILMIFGFALLFVIEKTKVLLKK